MYNPMIIRMIDISTVTIMQLNSLGGEEVGTTDLSTYKITEKAFQTQYIPYIRNFPIHFSVPEYDVE